MTKRPGWQNKIDSCCACGKLHPTPQDHEKPGKGELGVWQPNPTDPPQWICAEDRARLEADERRLS